MKKNEAYERVSAMREEWMSGDFSSLLGSIYTSNADAALIETEEDAEELAAELLDCNYEVLTIESVDIDEWQNACEMLDIADFLSVDCIVKFQNNGCHTYVAPSFAIA